MFSVYDTIQYIIIKQLKCLNLTVVLRLGGIIIAKYFKSLILTSWFKT